MWLVLLVSNFTLTAKIKFIVIDYSTVPPSGHLRVARLCEWHKQLKLSSHWKAEVKRSGGGGSGRAEGSCVVVGSCSTVRAAWMQSTSGQSIRRSTRAVCPIVSQSAVQHVNTDQLIEGAHSAAFRAAWMHRAKQSTHHSMKAVFPVVSRLLRSECKHWSADQRCVFGSV